MATYAETADKIIAVIRDRKGLGQVWDEIDEDLQSEIRDEFILAMEDLEK